ncbi:MAG: T9SS type A sorting domain-containing protein [Bacteroidales bacterium]|nr:T9SS type A sorting domain-containing protein [Bacteroidales bacterium]
MKHFILIITFVNYTLLTAQESTVAAGGDISGNGSVSYSIGQTPYLTHSSSSGSVAEGVQQPYEISVIDLAKSVQNPIHVSVFPNPTSQLLQINFENTKISGYILKIFDANGKQISETNVNQQEMQIDFSHYSAATYYLKIEDGTTTRKTFKIIKNQ